MLTVLRIEANDAIKLNHRAPAPKLEDTIALLKKFIESVFDPNSVKAKISLFQVNKNAKLLQSYGHQNQVQILLTERLKSYMNKHLLINQDVLEVSENSSSQPAVSESISTGKLIKSLSEFYSNLTKKIMPTLSSVLGVTAAYIDGLVTTLMTEILTSSGTGTGTEIMNCFNFLKNSQPVEHVCKVNSQTMNMIKKGVNKPVDKTDINSPGSASSISSPRKNSKNIYQVSRIIQEIAATKTDSSGVKKSGSTSIQSKEDSQVKSNPQPGPSTALSQRKSIINSLAKSKGQVSTPGPQTPMNIEEEGPSLASPKPLTPPPSSRHLLAKSPLKPPAVTPGVPPKTPNSLEWVCGALIAAVDTDRLQLAVCQLEDISTVCKILRRANCFDGEFKKTFLEQSGEFYRDLLHKRLPLNNLQEYTGWLEDKMQDERGRCDSLFDDSLSQSMHYVMKKILVDDIISTILNANFQTLLLEGHKKELTFYFELMKSSDIFDNFLAYFEGVVRTKVEACLSNREDAIETVFRFYHSMATLVKSVYKDESKVQTALDRSVESVISKSDTTFARQLGHWIAQKLETESTDLKIDENVHQTITLLRFVQNKKYFMSIYNQRLLIRLGKFTAVTTAKESSILERLQTEYGQAFVENSFDIIEQITKSRNLSIEFVFNVHNNTNLAQIELDVLVVPVSTWPFPTNKFKTISEKYKTFYSKKVEGNLTVLNFQPDVSTCSVNFNYKHGKSVLLESLTMYQAALLLLVSERTTVSVATATKYLELSKSDFEIEMEELFNFVPPILNRPSADLLSDSDRLSANTQFVYDRSFIKFNQGKLRDHTTHSAESDEKLYQEKKSVFESVTVRIMKEQKKKTHQDLFDQVSKRFDDEISDRDFRKIVQSLIKSDFIKRDEANPNLYHYIP